MTKGFTHESTENETVEWYTPPEIFERLGLEFDLDPCHPQHIVIPWVPATKRFTVEDNGLIQPWLGRVWLNPPYGKHTSSWLKKMSEHSNGVALVFARTDTEWFHKYASTAQAICFVKQRIRFMTSDLLRGNTPGSGSMLLAWGQDCINAVIKSGLGHCLTNQPTTKENTMSLEQSLERIAIALEKIAGNLTPTSTTVVNMASDTPTPEVVAPKAVAKAKATPAPAATAVKPEPAPAATAPAQAKPTHTLADVLDLLKKAAVKHGAPKIKQLMIDHGADAKMPKVETIPAVNYPALVSVVKSLDTPIEQTEGIF